jgi:hypothetical protein
VYVVLTDYHNPYNQRSHFCTRFMKLANPDCRKLNDNELYSRTEQVVHSLNNTLKIAVQSAGPSSRVVLASIHQSFHGRESPKPLCGSAPRYIQTPGCNHRAKVLVSLYYMEMTASIPMRRGRVHLRERSVIVPGYCSLLLD